MTRWLTDGRSDEQRAQYTAWVEELDRLGPPPTPVELPTDRALLERLGLHPVDLDETLATRPDPVRHPELWWLLERSHHQLVAGMGDVRGARWTAPHLPAELGAMGRFFYVHVVLASLPAALAYHRSRNVSAQMSEEIFADLGRQVAIHRRIHGRGGLDVQFWFGLHCRGLIFSFGRLQFNRGTAWYADATTPFAQGDLVLGAHIPESGPMTPEACDESFARAKKFYATHFPDEPYRYVTCTSWLLDDQLAEYLPADSNIIAFQRRFTLIEDAVSEGDDAVFQFVFRRVKPRLEDLPRRTTLERAIVDHLESGRHWRTRTGWLEL
ncbi:MAG TPA: acyltransferase domain-containing protein [Actinopolymorphaceae bacterium]